MQDLFSAGATLSNLADQIKQGVTVESPATTQDAGAAGEVHSEQAVPYARFQQVLAQRNEYEQQIAQTARQQAAQQGAGYQQVQEAGQSAGQQYQQAQELLTQEELNGFDQLMLTNPGEAVQRLTGIIYERGVKVETQKVRTELRQEMGQYVNQFASQMAPMALATYKSSKFAGNLQGASAIFDTLVATEMAQNPGVVNNPASLDLLRQMAIGKAYETGVFNQAPAQTPFSESAGSGFNFTPQGSMPDSATLQVGRLLGLDDKTTANIHNVFEKNGVYRT